VIFGPEGYFHIHRAHTAELALRRALPTIFDVRDYVDAGGWRATDRVISM
jgi:putative ABC transport system substrate-binding protein